MRSRIRKMFAALCAFACCSALEAQIASPSEPRAGNAAGFDRMGLAR